MLVRHTQGLPATVVPIRTRSDAGGAARHGQVQQLDAIERLNAIRRSRTWRVQSKAVRRGKVQCLQVFERGLVLQRAMHE